MIKFYKYSKRVSIAVMAICLMATACQIVNAFARGDFSSADVRGIIVIMFIGINAGVFLLISFYIWDRWIMNLIRAGKNPFEND